MRQVYFFSEEELELLKKELPYENPCTAECRRNTGCNGHCVREDMRDTFEKSIEPYVNAGIYEIAVKMKDVYMKQREIAKLKEKLQKLERDIDEAKSLYPQLFEKNFAEKKTETIKEESVKGLKARCRESFTLPRLNGTLSFLKDMEYEFEIVDSLYSVIHPSGETLTMLPFIFNHYFNDR